MKKTTAPRRASAILRTAAALPLCLSLSFPLCFAQGPPSGVPPGGGPQLWSISGNSNIGPNNFLGTTNPSALSFRTNDTARVFISPFGFIGFNTTSPLSRFHFSDGAFLITGTTGSTPVSGPGTRLMWVPGKMAFRAGTATGDEWDDANIGDGSFAVGTAAKASGFASVAIGQSVAATGAFTFARGSGATSAGDFSTVLGSGAQSNGAFSTAMGNSAVSDGDFSFAIGNSSFTSGPFSYSLGDNARASGAFAHAWGNNAEAEGSFSFAIGNGAVSRGDFSFTVGTSSSANGNFAFSIGNSSTANNDFSFAFGNSVTTNGAFSFGVGNSNTVDGDFAFAAGNSNLAGGNNSFVAGKSNNAGGHCSFAAGDNVTAGGNFSTAIGNRIAALADRSMVLGYGDGGVLSNNITNSLMIGMNSDLPTLFVGPSAGTGTTGNVGIGTADATQKLTVAGMIRSTTGGVMFPDGSVMTTAGVVSGQVDTLSVQGRITVGSGTLFLDGASQTGGENSVYTSGGSLLIQSNGGNANHTLIGNGDTHSSVGIGTNNPQKKLHVRTFHTIDQVPQGGSHYGMRLEDVLTGEGGFPVSATTTWDIEPKAGGTEGSTLQIGTPGSPLLTMTETGRIGVNTSTPLAALHVAGDVQTDGNLSAGSGRIAGLYAGADGLVGVGTTTPRADLDVNGRVTIGSSTQVDGPHADYTLAVDGKIVAKDVIIKLEDWADYVCDSAYALMSPAEMKAFMAKHKHLPGMPSEQELRQRGLDIKEMQRLQQVKIEEYAKYIILLNERLTELEKKDALLEKKMQRRKGLREARKAKRTLKNMP